MVLVLIKGFFCIYWDDQVVFVFASVNVVYYVYWFAYVEPPLHSWDEAYLVMVNNLFDIYIYICIYVNICSNIYYLFVEKISKSSPLAFRNVQQIIVIYGHPTMQLAHQNFLCLYNCDLVHIDHTPSVPTPVSGNNHSHCLHDELLDCTYEWGPAVLAFLCLAYFT
jgi:hypothetical protein